MIQSWSYHENQGPNPCWNHSWHVQSDAAHYAGCDLSLSKVFISFCEEEGGQENVVIILKSISLLQKNGKNDSNSYRST